MIALVEIGKDEAMSTDPLDALRASADRLAALVEPLTPDELRLSAYPTEWTIAQVLSHLGSGAVDHAASPRRHADRR